MLWLLEWLPEGSAYYASQRGGPEHRAWPLPVLLAAGALNALNGANWQRGGGRGQQPTPIKPPTVRMAGHRGEKRRGVAMRGAAAHRMAQMRAQQEAPTPQAPPKGTTTDS